MRLNHDEQRWLGRAFTFLNSGDWRRFEDMLWLGFGDAWKPMLDKLAETDHVELRGSMGDEPRLTPRGEELLGRINGATQAMAG